MPHAWSHMAPQNLWGWLLLASCTVAISVVAMLIWLIVGQRGETARSHPRTTPAQERALERDVRNLTHELAEMAREVGAELDARAIRLEELIRDADDRLAALERARSFAPIQPRILDEPMSPPPSPLPAHPAIAPSPQEPDFRHVEIYTLADEGLALADIAARLRRPKGEVELILALRPEANRVRVNGSDA